MRYLRSDRAIVRVVAEGDKVLIGMFVHSAAMIDNCIAMIVPSWMWVLLRMCNCCIVLGCGESPCCISISICISNSIIMFHSHHRVSNILIQHVSGCSKSRSSGPLRSVRSENRHGSRCKPQTMPPPMPNLSQVVNRIGRNPWDSVRDRAFDERDTLRMTCCTDRDGASEGWKLRLSDGLSDGSSDGTPLGTTDGPQLGPPDGLSDGLSDGKPDGIPDGTSDRIPRLARQGYYFNMFA